MSEHAFAFYTQHKAEYQRKWETRKKNANNRGNYEDGVFYSEKPTITNCCVCQNYKGHIKNFDAHIKTEGHQINLQGPLVQISFNNLTTFCSSAFLRRFQKYSQLLQSFGSFFPLRKQNYYLSYSEEIELLPTLYYKPNSLLPDIKRYKKDMSKFDIQIGKKRPKGKSASNLKTQYSSNTIDYSGGQQNLPICAKATRYLTPEEQYESSDQRDYGEFQYTRRDVRRIGDEEVNRNYQLITSGYSRKDFAWDLLYHLARQKKSINQELLNEMPEQPSEIYEIQQEVEKSEEEQEEIEVSFTSLKPAQSQVLQKIDYNISPSKKNGLNKRMTAAVNPPQSQSLISLIEKVQKIEEKQRNTEVSFRKKKYEKSDNRKRVCSQWSSQIAQLLSDQFKCGDQNIFTQEWRSSENLRGLKRDEKKKAKSMRKKIK